MLGGGGGCSPPRQIAGFLQKGLGFCFYWQLFGSIQERDHPAKGQVLVHEVVLECAYNVQRDQT